MSDEIKKAIAASIRKEKQICTAMGEIEITDSRLGEGGNSVVYPVNFAGPAVAKIFHEAVGAKPSKKVTRFIDEYRRLIRVPLHPGIIRLFHFDIISISTDAGIVLRVPTIIMERCVCSLRDTRKKCTEPASPDSIEKFLTQICSALDHIHSNGIVHRDLKPENILVREDGSYVLADFGIAWFDPAIHTRNHLTEPTERLANFQFAAPEQIFLGKKPTHLIDIYALGQIVYWLISGEVVRGTDYAPLKTYGAAFQRFDKVVRRMIAQNPAQRPQSGSEVMSELKQDHERKKNQEDARHVISSIMEFNRRLARLVPGKYGVLKVVEPTDIDRILHGLARRCESYELWWTRGMSNSPIPTMKKEGDTWVIDSIEFSVTSLWVGRDGGRVDHRFVLLRSDPMPQFDVYAGSEFSYQEAAFFRGHYVRRSEYDDGYTLIEGKSVRLKGATVRCRYCEPHYILMATKHSPILVFSAGVSTSADSVVGKLIESIERSDRVNPLDLEKLFLLKRHPTSALYD